MVEMDRGTRQIITDHLKTRYVAGAPSDLEIIVSLDRLIFCRDRERIVEIWMHPESTSIRNISTGAQKSVCYDSPEMFELVDQWILEYLSEAMFEEIARWWPQD